MFSDFIDHFSGMDDKQIVKDVRKSIEDLAECNSRGKSFGAFIVKSTNDRIAKVRKKKVEAGRKGGLSNIAKYRKIKELTAQNNYQVTTTHATTPTISTDNVETDNVKLDIGKLSQDATNGNAVDDRKVATSCDTLKADGDIREDSQAIPDGSAITRNETRAHDALDTSANNYGPRQAKNGDASTSDGADVSTTVSRNMRRVPQNEAPAHGFSGGRTAQGTMSRSPEAAAQSGKASALDCLPDKDGQSAKTRDTSASCRYAQPSCSPEDGNHYDQEVPTSTYNPKPDGLTGPTAGGSCGEISDAATTSRASTVSTNPSQEAPTRKAGDELIESGNGSLRNPPPSCEEHLDKALESQRTGAAPDRVKNQPSSHCGKAPVRSFGESGLVHMTDAQANSLRSYYGEDFDRAVGILENYILSLPSKAEGDEKGEAKFWREDYAKRNHYFAMRRDNWVDNALKKAKTADKRLENASNPNYKSFKQQDIDARTEFFSKSIFDGKEAI